MAFLAKSETISSFFSSKGLFREKSDRSRCSCERQHPSPLLDECRPNENRYYRSAEFQQALLQQKDDYSPLFDFEPTWEDFGRRSRHVRRRSAFMTKLPFFHTRPTNDVASEPVILPGANGRRWLTYTLGMSAISSSAHFRESEADTAARWKKADRTSVWLEGVGHLIDYAKNKKFE